MVIQNFPAQYKLYSRYGSGRRKLRLYLSLKKSNTPFEPYFCCQTQSRFLDMRPPESVFK